MNKIKIAVLSDTHGEMDKLDKIVEILNSLSNLDMIIHLGDFASDADYIRSKTNVDMVNVIGNCDFGLEEINEEKIININGKKILLTHGHKYRIKDSLNDLYYRARELEVDAILFGHIHIPVNVMEDGILLFNPGSISEPRGGSTNSYGLLTISDTIESKILEI